MWLLMEQADIERWTAFNNSIISQSTDNVSYDYKTILCVWDFKVLSFMCL